MSQFARPVDKHVKDLLVPAIEALRHLSDELNHHIPENAYKFLAYVSIPQRFD